MARVCFCSAAAGVTVSYVSKFIGWAENADRIRLEGQLEDISQQMLRVRMGTGNSRDREQ